MGTPPANPLFLRVPDPAGPKFVPVDFLDMGYSPSYPILPGQPVVFFRATEDPERPYLPARQLVIPPGIKEPLLLLQVENDSLAHRWFDLDPAITPFGSTLVVNLSPRQILTAMDEDSHLLPPGQTHAIPPPGQEREKAWLRLADAGERKVFFSSMLIRRQAKRMLLFIVEEGTELQTRLLVDFEPAPEAEDTPKGE
jgi:hypothetical protein